MSAPGRRWFVPPVIALAALVACAPNAPRRAITLATTTSVANSGLLDALRAAFHNEHGIELRPHLVGSGRALVMLANSQADIVISHAPEAEAAALRSHPDWWYRKIMFNEFVLVGPPSDPARVRGAADISGALQRIVTSRSVFVSRGDESGTHERETALWRRAGTRPRPTQLLTSGSGMAATLRAASDREAYALSDEATLAQLASVVELAVLFRGGAELVNTYAVVVPAPARADRASTDARSLATWLAEGGGRSTIARFRIRDFQPFRVWPPGRPAGSPADLPYE